MKPLLAICSIATLLVAASPALAAPTEVNLRVEGLAGTIFEAPVTTDAKTIDGHPCDGTNGGANPGPGPTMTSALDDAAATGAFTWSGTWFSGFDDFGIDRIGPDANDSANSRYWGYALNYVATSVGGCQQQVKRGDDVIFGYDFFSKAHLLKLTGPNRAETGANVGVGVVDGGGDQPISGASVGGSTSDASGTATIRFAAPGVYRLQAERADSLRSNTLEICVFNPGSTSCDAFVPSVGPGAIAVRDFSAPQVGISGLRDGRRFRKRGPRLFRGTASDSGSGLDVVKLSLRRRHAGRCQWWSATAERFSGADCRRKVFFTIGHDRQWSYQLPHALAPGHYVLDVKASDRAGNRAAAPVRGLTRITFEVTNGRAHARAHSSARRAPRVRAMAVGRGNEIVAGPRTVVARAATVRVSGRSCRVGAATPLAGLLALVGRRGLALEDYGRCGGRPSDSSQLFVRQISGQRNAGADGWVYRLRGAIPGVGAADTSQRMRSQDGLVWSYCVHDAAGNCPPQLDLKPSRLSVACGAGASLAVRRLDDEGRARPAAGASVRCGQVAAAADGAGMVTLALPPGRCDAQATSAGDIPSLPAPLTVVAR